MGVHVPFTHHPCRPFLRTPPEDSPQARLAQPPRWSGGSAVVTDGDSVREAAEQSACRWPYMRSDTPVTGESNRASPTVPESGAP